MPREAGVTIAKPDRGEAIRYTITIWEERLRLRGSEVDILAMTSLPYEDQPYQQCHIPNSEDSSIPHTSSTLSLQTNVTHIYEYIFILNPIYCLHTARGRA